MLENDARGGSFVTRERNTITGPAAPLEPPAHRPARVSYWEESPVEEGEGCVATNARRKKDCFGGAAQAVKEGTSGTAGATTEVGTESDSTRTQTAFGTEGEATAAGSRPSSSSNGSKIILPIASVDDVNRAELVPSSSLQQTQRQRSKKK